MKIPNFFIVGAPKCGTTAMVRYLRAHPQIFIPEIKEPFFFGRDFKIKGRPSMGEYLSYFAKANLERRIGEATVWYLYSREAAREIKEFNPSSRIIIMLRNPVDFLYSLHSELVYVCDEDIDSFEAALEAEGDRKKSLRIPKNVTFPECLYYRAVASFSEQVKRYLDTFGKERVMVLLLEEFKEDPLKIYRNILRFLEVDPSFQPSFEVVNPNKYARSKLIMRYLCKPPRIIHSASRILIPYRVRKRLLQALFRLNTKFSERPRLDSAYADKLNSTFAGEICNLSKLIGRDLTIWQNPNWVDFPPGAGQISRSSELIFLRSFGPKTKRFSSCGS